MLTARRRLPAPRPTLIGVGLAAGSALLSACFATTDQVERLTRRVTELESRTEALQTDVGAQIDHARTKVAELEDVLERATQVVTRSSADTGAQVEQLQVQIARQEGAIAELQHELARLQAEFREQQADYEDRMKKLARRAGVDMPLDDAEIPANREAHFQAAVAAFEARDFSTARALYRAYVSRYRDDARADDAQLAIGRSYLIEDRPATALGELRHVISDFQQGDAVPAALLAMADAFYRLGACTEARDALDALIRGYPRSPLVTEARTKQRDIQRAPAGYCTQ